MYFIYMWPVFFMFGCLPGHTQRYIYPRAIGMVSLWHSHLDSTIGGKMPA